MASRFPGAIASDPRVSNRPPRPLEQRGLGVWGAHGMVLQEAAGTHREGMNHLGLEASQAGVFSLSFER